jgi:aminoglycoside phosphotransferase (APT) family kinase protein
MDINLSLVVDLIAKQFPQWEHLSIRSVELSGIDNRTFRLGDTMLIRMPSAEGYSLQVLKEQKWLPVLAPHLSVPIPEPIAIGAPSKNYPWQWSIYRWIEGTSANALSIDDLKMPLLAAQLAQFLKELHQVDATDGPVSGPHNYYRGAHPSVYDLQTRSAISALQNLIDADKATSAWDAALNSEWSRPLVWVHGDFASGNILVKGGELTAVIDFGCMGVGDPACDLVIAWTFFKDEARAIFKESLDLDSNTWVRARGWALWKALITLDSLSDKTCPAVTKQLNVINEILNECS